MTKKQKLAQERNRKKKAVELMISKKENYKDSVVADPVVLQYYNKVIENVYKDVKAKAKYICAPEFIIKKIYKSAGVYLLDLVFTRDIILEDGKIQKAKELTTYTLIQIINTYGAPQFTNEKGQIYTDTVKNIESVKEIIKVENKGIKQSQLDKATKNLLHKHKNSAHFSFIESILDEFKSML